MMNYEEVAHFLEDAGVYSLMSQSEAEENPDLSCTSTDIKNHRYKLQASPKSNSVINLT